MARLFRREFAPDERRFRPASGPVHADGGREGSRRAPQHVPSADRLPSAAEHSRPSPAATRSTGSRSKNSRQTVAPPHGSSYPPRTPPKRLERANPAITDPFREPPQSKSINNQISRDSGIPDSSRAENALA